MSVILAFEASADACSVSLRLSSTEVKILKSEKARAHAAYLLPFTQTLLDGAGCSINDVDVIACAVGPGSFTGLRIALSVAQGLAFSADKKIIPINSLSALAFSARAPSGSLVIPMMDARMNEVYWGAFNEKGEPIDGQYEAVLGSEESLFSALASLPSAHNFVSVGDAWSSIKFARTALSSLPAHQSTSAQVDAGHIAELAAKLDPSFRVDPQLVDLCYCRNSIAWNKRTRIRA